MSRNDLTEAWVILERETFLAYGVKEHEDGELIWLPKSKCRIEERDDRTKEVLIAIPEWLAEEKGLM